MTTEPSDSPFREQALRARDEPAAGSEPILRIAPGWTRLTYRALVAFGVVLLLFLVLARVNHHVDGTAIIRIGGTHQVSARSDEVVEHIRVQPGQHVDTGDLLLEFHAREIRDQLDQASEAYEEAVRAWLLNPTLGAGVAEARNRLRAVRARLAERELRAPHAGLVVDVRVRPGQPVSTGQVLLTQAGLEGGNLVTVFLPGQSRPRLHEGQTLRLELHGHPFSRLELELERIDSELIGVEEARSLLGFGLADALGMSGTVVRAQARIEDPHFLSQGRRLRLHDGMTAQAQVQLDSQPLVLALLPGTR